MRGLIAQSLVGGVCCVCLCGDGQTAQLVSDPSRFMTLADEVRETIRPQCGSCHTSTFASARPGAVQVFDLVKADWSAGMSFAQLEKFRSRLARLDHSKRQRVEEFVRNEQRKRSARSE